MPERLQDLCIPVWCQAHSGLRHQRSRRCARDVDQEVFGLQIASKFFGAVFSSPIGSKCFEADVRQFLSIGLISSRPKRGTQVRRIVGDPLVEKILLSEKGSSRRFGLLKVAAL